jgi:hypothetical protein
VLARSVHHPERPGGPELVGIDAAGGRGARPLSQCSVTFARGAHVVVQATRLPFDPGSSVAVCASRTTTVLRGGVLEPGPRAMSRKIAR